jgi:hypothetical protein
MRGVPASKIERIYVRASEGPPVHPGLQSIGLLLLTGFLILCHLTQSLRESAQLPKSAFSFVAS